MHYLRSSSSIHALPNELPDRGELQITCADRSKPSCSDARSVFYRRPGSGVEMTPVLMAKQNPHPLHTTDLEYSRLESSNEIQPMQNMRRSGLPRRRDRCITTRSFVR